MKVTIIKNDGMVYVDGEARKVDLSSFPADIHAVQWDSVKEVGHVEYVDEDPTDGECKPNETLTKASFKARFGSYVPTWKKAK